MDVNSTLEARETSMGEKRVTETKETKEQTVTEKKDAVGGPKHDPDNTASKGYREDDKGSQR